MVTQVNGLVVEQCGSELVVFVPTTNEAHSLNATAALIFKLCDGATTQAQMITALREVGLPADRDVVSLALADLTEASLVIVDDAAAEPGLTRRRVIRRLGLSATAIAMLPVVETIFVQPAAAQTSGMPMTTTFFLPTTTTTPLPFTTP